MVPAFGVLAPSKAFCGLRATQGSESYIEAVNNHVSMVVRMSSVALRMKAILEPRLHSVPQCKASSSAPQAMCCWGATWRGGRYSGLLKARCCPRGSNVQHHRRAPHALPNCIKSARLHHPAGHSRQEGFMEGSQPLLTQPSLQIFRCPASKDMVGHEHWTAGTIQLAQGERAAVEDLHAMQ